MSNISLITKIYKSRKIVLDQLKTRGYDISEYENFSFNEIHVLNQNNQLDMLLSSSDESIKKSCYVKYHMTGKLTKGIIDDTIDDLFTMESILNDDDDIVKSQSVLTEEDDLIIIIKDKINDTLKSFITNLYNKDKKFVSVYNINRYLFNILEHNMVPPHEPLTLEEKKNLEKKYNIMNEKQWPEINRFDPVAQAIGLRPNQLCKIYRKSPTSLVSIYYRLCI